MGADPAKGRPISLPFDPADLVETPTGADPAKGANPRRPPGRDGGACAPGPARKPCGHRAAGLPVTAVPTATAGPGARYPNSRLAWTPMAVRRGGGGRTPSRTSRAQVHVMAVRKGRVSSPPMAAASAPVMIQGHPCAALPILARKIRPQSWRLRPAVFRPAPPSRARQGPAASPQGMRAGVPRPQSAYGRRPSIQGSLPGAGPIAPPKSRVQGACGQAGPVPST